MPDPDRQVERVVPQAPPPAIPDAPSAPGAPTPYIQRKIDVTFQLGYGAFVEGGQNTLTLRGHRCSVTVDKAGNTPQTACQARIWGMGFSLMQKLSTYGLQFGALRQDKITIQAGDDLAGMSTVFVGSITNAYFDGASQPDVAFQVVAYQGAFEALKPAPVVTIQGGVDVAGVMKMLADRMGVGFENHGVVAKLRDIYYPGTAFQQMHRIAEHAGINAILDDTVLAIWPRGQSRGAGSIPLITPLSGMKDYPTFDSQGVIVTCLFQPLVFGARIAIASQLWNNEKRFYNVYGYTYQLESESPGGAWHSTFMATTTPL